jgi:hypothetical protein
LEIARPVQIVDILYQTLVGGYIDKVQWIESATHYWKKKNVCKITNQNSYGK